MAIIHIGAAALNQTPLDWNGNRDRILDAIYRAGDARVGLLCLPELCISGYGCEDAFLSTGVRQMAIDVLAEILPATEGIAVTLGIPFEHQGRIYNMSGIAAAGRLWGLVGKQHLTRDGIHYEPRWFDPWPVGVSDTVTIAGHPTPIGDLFFEFGGVEVGFEICEDAWVNDRPGRELMKRGVSVILNPSASHFAFGKTKIREQLVMELIRAAPVHYVLCNMLGNEAGRAIYDGQSLIGSGGEIVARGKRFSFADVQLTTAWVDVADTNVSEADRAVEASGPRRVVVDFVLPSTSESVSPIDRAAQGDWESSADIKQEEFSRAVALGLFDYLRKSHARGFVVSLSGGADSAAVAVLVALMARFACEELGADGMRKKLASVPRLSDCDSPGEMVRELLSCVYQSTSNSSQTTRDAAATVARMLDATFFEFDVQPFFQGYLEIVSTAIGRPLDWKTDDIPLQNIQARSRAPGVWLLANLRGALLLATSNRSEAAVGYTTMDGDTCGGLSPIAGIDKAFLREWLDWMRLTGPRGFGPMPELSVVTKQQPTAELRPLEQGQTDEADLMPYSVLDTIERAAIRDKLTPLEVYVRMRESFGEYSAEQLAEWVERFFCLWCRNQWKRERYAPSFHLDDENLDPKTWCRFPILSGGYERELAELRQYVANQ